MPTKDSILEAINLKKQKFIEKNLLYIEKESARLQRELLVLLTNEFISKLKFDASGNLLYNTYNFKVINSFDALMDDFSKTYLQPFVSNIGANMLELTVLNAEYFAEFTKKATVDNLVNKLGFLSERIGIDKNGNVIKGSYLSDLAKTPELRTELKEYVVQNVVNKNGMMDFQKGFGKILKNTDDAEGAMTRYYKQYTYDTFNQVDETINSYMADSLGLEYGVYSGTIMKRSRCFCIKRVGKVFHISDLDNWKNDPTLIEKSTKDSYNPRIERGRYNCRHNWIWISKERAEQLGYDKEEAAAVVPKTCPSKNKGS